MVSLINAQVNTEAMRNQSGAEGIYNVLGIDFGFEKSDQEILDLAAEYRIDYVTTNGFHAFVAMNYENGYEKESGKEKNTIQNKGFGHLRVTKNISSSLGLEVFAQFGFNDFLLMKDRRLVGGGLRVNLINSEKTNSFLGIGLMQENEEYDLTGETGQKLVRSTNYLSWNMSITKNTALNNTAYVQIASSYFGDYRILYDGSLEFELSQKISFSVEINYRYDNKPHGDLGKSYIEISNGINFNF